MLLRHANELMYRAAAEKGICFLANLRARKNLSQKSRILMEIKNQQELTSLQKTIHSLQIYNTSTAVHVMLTMQWTRLQE